THAAWSIGALAPSRQQEGGDGNNCEHGGEEDPFHSSTSSARSCIDWCMVSPNHVLEKSSFASSKMTPSVPGSLEQASRTRCASSARAHRQPLAQLRPLPALCPC